MPFYTQVTVAGTIVRMSFYEWCTDKSRRGVVADVERKRRVGENNVDSSFND